ncbi:hypothetical protein CC2G_005312 [Coprinopsis cinerea AmutBmut pab1-1]|nr:hypothetical protein CC2G_005312 [Coprinopsis cinerea AmutBmut pab1-1]
MRTLAVFALLAVSAGTALAAPYPGDIVQYWNLRTTWSINATNPRQGGYYEAYAGAFVQTAILAAAQDASRHPRAVQQLSVSYAAHDALASLYDLQYQTIDSYLTEIEDIITPTSSESSIARRIGESAAAKVTRARAGDGYGRYKRYEWQAPAPGVYQPTPPNNPFPAAQHGGQLRPWGGVEKVPEWGPPPSPTDDGYEKFLLQVKEKGSKTNSTRTADETEIGYFWLESSITAWNRYATTIIGDSLKDSVLKSAEFYAKLNWALANAAIVSTHTKNKASGRTAQIFHQEITDVFCSTTHGALSQPSITLASSSNLETVSGTRRGSLSSPTQATKITCQDTPSSVVVQSRFSGTTSAVMNSTRQSPSPAMSCSITLAQSVAPSPLSPRRPKRTVTPAFSSAFISNSPLMREPRRARQPRSRF